MPFPFNPARWQDGISPIAGDRRVVDSRIKPYAEQQAEQARRVEQTRAFHRNQAIGLVLMAVSILIFWMFRTNPHWLFPAGWWRL
jgi:hypothetical protein